MKPKFYRKVLGNGMTVIFEKRNLPVVSVAFAVRAGGIHESPKEKGISHFIEHMLYKGTQTRDAKKIAEEIEKNGGELNGFTSEMLTAFWCKMPSKHLDVAFEVLSDIVKNPLFEENEVEKERNVIFEEIKMYHDNPRLHVFDEIQKLLYTGTMSISLAGTIKTMKSIGKKELMKKFRQTYKPNNMILCVVGNADFSEIVDFAEKNFGKEKNKVSSQKIGMRNKVKVEKRKGVDQANLVFAYHVPLAGEKKSYASMVLSTLMAGGMSSRLFQEIREKRNLAYAVKGDYEINKKFAHAIIYVGTTKENVGKVKEIIFKEFKEVAEKLSQSELNQIKEQLIGNYHISMEDSQNQMINLLLHEIDGDAEEFYKFVEKISAVKLRDVKELASKINKGNYSFFVLEPE